MFTIPLNGLSATHRLPIEETIRENVAQKSPTPRLWHRDYVITISQTPTLEKEDTIGTLVKREESFEDEKFWRAKYQLKA